MGLMTISRHMGCGGLIIARNVAKNLNVELFDDDGLQEEALKMGIRSADLKGLNEKAPGLFDRVLTAKPEIYIDLMEAVIYEVARKGNGVILGHGSQILLQDFGCALHVLIHAKESIRIENMVIQRGLSRDAATKLIHKRDQEQKGFFRYAFHMDWDDPSLYDLTINTEKMGIDFATKLIVEAFQSERVKTCSMTAADAMEKLSQTKRISAALLQNDINVTAVHVEVEEKGVAKLSGWANTEEERAHILNVVKKVPGISQVQAEIAIVPAYGV